MYWEILYLGRYDSDDNFTCSKLKFYFFRGLNARMKKSFDKFDLTKS